MRRPQPGHFRVPDALRQPGAVDEIRQEQGSQVAHGLSSVCREPVPGGASGIVQCRRAGTATQPPLPGEWDWVPNRVPGYPSLHGTTSPRHRLRLRRGLPVVRHRPRVVRAGARAPGRRGGGEAPLRALRAQPRHGARGRRDGSPTSCASTAARPEQVREAQARIRERGAAVGFAFGEAQARVEHLRRAPDAALGRARGPRPRAQAGAAPRLSRRRPQPGRGGRARRAGRRRRAGCLAGEGDRRRRRVRGRGARARTPTGGSGASRPCRPWS